MKRLVVAVGLATLLGPLAFTPSSQAHALPPLPIPVPTVSPTPLPQPIPAIPAIPAIPPSGQSPSPSPTPTPTSVTIPPLVPAPVQTIIERVPVPGPVRTIIQSSPTPVPFPVPGPERTVLVPGPERTVLVPGPVRTVVTERVVVRQVPGPRVTVEASPRVTPSPVVVFRNRPGIVDLTTPEAIGISIGLVALGIALSLIALFLVYGLGFKEAKSSEEAKLANLNDELFGR